LALENEHLLSEGEDLTISIIGYQTTNQGGDGRENQQDDVPEHDPRTVVQLTGVKGKKALELCGA
jgi:hypothetical protein